jgi:hypothetical protein
MSRIRMMRSSKRPAGELHGFGAKDFMKGYASSSAFMICAMGSALVFQAPEP